MVAVVGTLACQTKVPGLVQGVLQICLRLLSVVFEGGAETGLGRDQSIILCGVPGMLEQHPPMYKGDI